VNRLVLSGTPRIVPSGTRSSCHWGPETRLIRCFQWKIRLLNASNLESFGFYLTQSALFGIIGPPRDTQHREAPKLPRKAHYILIDGPPRVATLTRSALLAADLALVPVQPSPFDGGASSKILNLIEVARMVRRGIVARFVLNRCPARAVTVRATAEAFADHDPAMLEVRIGQRVVFAGAARSGRIVAEVSPSSAGAREIEAFGREVEGLVR